MQQFISYESLVHKLEEMLLYIQILLFSIQRGIIILSQVVK